MNLASFGYGYDIEKITQRENLSYEELARVIRQDRDRYIIVHERGYLEGIPTGNLLFASSDQASLPVVGDWVVVTLMDRGADKKLDGQAIIHRVVNRRNVLERKVAGQRTVRQLLAANLDEAIILQAAGQDFNLRRLERYLSGLGDQDIQPVVIINKADLLEKKEEQELKELMNRGFPQLQVFYMSCKNHRGVDVFLEYLKISRTYCFLGSSGVGKSTLLNLLAGGEVQKTQDISHHTSKGKHTTTRRELFPLPNGALIIDTPGMREFGMTGDSQAEAAFPEIQRLADACQFADCRHEHEPGCAVLKAVETGDVDRQQYESYVKLRREQEHYARSEAEKRQRGRDFGKMQKEVKRFKDRWKG